MFRSIATQMGCFAFLTGALLMPTVAQTGDSAGVAPPQDVLAAEAEGLVEVRFIANDSRSAQVLVTNRGDRPLTLRLPAAFAGIPVLAQMGQQGAGFGAGGIGGVPQNVGGGGMQNQGMGIGGAQGGNPFCWVAREVYGVHDPRWLEFRQWMTWQAPRWVQDVYASHGERAAGWLHDRPVAKAAVRSVMELALGDTMGIDGPAALCRVSAPIDGATKPFTVPAGKTLTIRAPTVCLDHGRREPTTRIPYRMVALETVSEDPRLPVILGGLASGHLSQKVAQAAAWHVSSGRTWDQLAAEVIDRAGGDPDLPVFSAGELAAARRAVEVAARFAASAPAAQAPVDSAGR